MRYKFLLLSIVLITVGGFCDAQSQKFIGTWEGKLNVGVELRIVFRVSVDSNNILISSAESPDQSNKAIKCDTTFLSGDNITIEMRKLKASFTGKLSGNNTLTGEFTQGASIPLVLKKVDKVSQKNRPQEPKAPFPYNSEDIIYTNSDQSLSYGATITIPPGNGPFPAALLITGSGAQNRDEEILGHRSFAVLADHLSRQGYIVLRVDDRGVGQSTGDFNDATSADFAKDVHAGVDYLMKRTETDKTKIGLIGHSEGGMIAPMVATQRQDIDFIVLMAGPGVKIVDLMAEQASAMLASYGASTEAVDAYRKYYKQTAEELVKINDTAAAITAAKSIAENWAGTTSKPILKETGMKDEEARNSAAITMARTFSGKWFKYFMSFDPEPYLLKLNSKLLAINGDKDIQVVSKQNLPAIKTAIQKTGIKIYEIKELPGLNHLFQTCKKCTAQEYGDLEETIAPIALTTISEWLNKNVK